MISTTELVDRGVAGEQQRLFGVLKRRIAGGFARNTLQYHTGIAAAALVRGGAHPGIAGRFARLSEARLIQMGITQPNNRLPWN